MAFLCFSIMQSDVKLLLLGESSAGKTSLIKYRIYHRFDDATVPTAPVNFFKQTSSLTVPGYDPVEVNMNIWDTAGQDKYRALATNFFRLARVALLVGDVTSRSSMEAAFSYWLPELRKNVPDVIVFFAANKHDLIETGVEKEAMTKAEIDELCNTNDIVQWEYVSAKTGSNVDRLFNSICITVAADMGIIENISSCVSLKYKIDVEDPVDDDIEVPTIVLQNLNKVRSVRLPSSGEGQKTDTSTTGTKGESGTSQKSVAKGELPDPETVDLTKDISEKKKKKDKCC